MSDNGNASSADWSDRFERYMACVRQIINIRMLMAKSRSTAAVGEPFCVTHNGRRDGLTVPELDVGTHAI